MSRSRSHCRLTHVRIGTEPYRHRDAHRDGCSTLNLATNTTRHVAGHPPTSPGRCSVRPISRLTKSTYSPYNAARSGFVISVVPAAPIEPGICFPRVSTAYHTTTVAAAGLGPTLRNG